MGTERILEGVLGIDSEEYRVSGREVGLGPDKTYDDRSIQWNLSTVNQLAGVFVRDGLALQQVAYPVTHEYQPGTVSAALAGTFNSFVIIDPGPKALEDLAGKLRVEGVADSSHVYDFLRATVVGASRRECERIEAAIALSLDLGNFFASLSDAERTLTTGRTIPAVTPVGNDQSAPELLEMVRGGREFAKTFRFKIGGATRGQEFYHLSSDPPGVVRRNPPPGVRVSAVVMTPKVFEFMNDPQSPAHHSRYVERRSDTRGKKQ